jgi:hypothetical protein
MATKDKNTEEEHGEEAGSKDAEGEAAGKESQEVANRTSRGEKDAEFRFRVEFRVSSQQGRQDSNLQPPVLEAVNPGARQWYPACLGGMGLRQLLPVTAVRYTSRYTFLASARVPGYQPARSTASCTASGSGANVASSPLNPSPGIPSSNCSGLYPLLIASATSARTLGSGWWATPLTNAPV